MIGWQKHIEAQAESRETAAEYCRQRGLKINQFLYWRSKSKDKPAGKFLPIGESNSGSFEVIVSDRIKIKVPDKFDAGVLRHLVEALNV